MIPEWVASTSKAVIVLTAACVLSCVTALALPQPTEQTTIVITATATDSSGLASAAHTVLTVVSSENDTSLNAAKSLRDGEQVHVTDLVAVTSSADLAGVFYGQRADRTGGIGIIWNGSVGRGDAVDVTGTMVTRSGERFIEAQVVTSVPTSP